MSELKDWLFNEALPVVGETVQKTLLNWYNAEMKAAYQRGCDDQQQNDAARAVKVFLSLKLDDGTIFRLLSEYLEINDTALAIELITFARYQIVRERLKAMCFAEGMDNIAFCKYETEHHVKEKVKANPKLIDYPDDKLRAAIEKK